jgi:hypothetical protein
MSNDGAGKEIVDFVGGADTNAIINEVPQRRLRACIHTRRGEHIEGTQELAELKRACTKGRK